MPAAKKLIANYYGAGNF